MSQSVSARLLKLTVLIVVACCSVSHGQLSISPLFVEPTVYPGATATFRVNVGNNGKEVLNCAIRVSAMMIDIGGLPQEADESPRSCKDWIKAEPTEFTLGPREGRQIICRMNVPRNVSGGYYAIVSVLGSPEKIDMEAGGRRGIGAGIELTHKALVPILVTVPGPRVQAVIEAAEPTITRASGKGCVMTLPIRNTGNIHCRMAGTVEIRSESDQLVERFDLSAGRGFILPLHERVFRSRLQVSLPDGLYVAKIRLDAQGYRAPMQNAFPFYVRNGVPVVAQLSEEEKQELLSKSAGFAVVPQQMYVEAPAGGWRMRAVELVNMTAEPIRVQGRVMEWFRDPTGHDQVLATSPAHGRSLKDYLELREPEIELSPRSRRRVPVSIAPPADATGEGYAAVYFDRPDMQLDASPESRARRSCLMRVRAGKTGTVEGRIEEFTAVQEPSGVVTMRGVVRNTGTLSIRPDVRFSVLDDQGRTLSKPLPAESDFAIQAGAAGLFTVSWPQVLEPGDYDCVITVRYAAGLPPIFRRTKFAAGMVRTLSEPAPEEGSQVVDESPSTAPDLPQTQPAALLQAVPSDDERLPVALPQEAQE